MHVALGRPYRGHRVNSGPVVYCALEGVQGFKNRIEAFRRAKLSGDDKRNPAFYLMTTPLGLALDGKALIADIKKQFGALKPAVVCLDTLNRSLEGSESSDEDMAGYIRASDAIHQAFNCLVLIVHHCGHDERRPRGHSSLIAAVDTQIAVSRDAAGNIVAELELSKDGEIGLSFASRLRVVDIGIDEDGDPITSCVVEAVESPVASEAGKRAKKQPKPHQAMLRALRRAIEEVGVQVTSNTIPRSVRVVSVDTWRRYAYQAGISPTRAMEETG
jgi:AAA domain